MVTTIMDYFKKPVNLKNKKTIAAIIGTVLLFIALPLTVIGTLQLSDGKPNLRTSATTPPDEVGLRLFIPPTLKASYTQSAKEIANQFEVTVGFPDPKPLHTANSKVRVLRYHLGPYVSEVDKDELISTGRRQALAVDSNPSLTANDAADPNGDLVTPKDWPHNYLVAPDNSVWLDFLREQINQVLNVYEGSYDGIFFDSMGTGPVDGFYVAPQDHPINLATSQPYTRAEWLAVQNVMLQAAREVLEARGKFLVLNGLINQASYFIDPENESTMALLTHANGAMAESPFRKQNASLTSWQTAANWLKTIEMIEDVSGRGLMNFWLTEIEESVITDPDDPLISQWRRFTLASYLLAAGPKSYYNFVLRTTDNNADGNPGEYFEEYGAPLGSTNVPRSQIGTSGVYTRPFANGLVLVNPTESVVSGLTPEGTAGKNYISWGENNSLSPPFTIPAHTGLILSTEDRGFYIKDPDLLGDALVTGQLIGSVDWFDLEPTEDSYSWSKLDNAVSAAVAAGKRIRLKIGAGMAAPPWLIGTTEPVSVPDRVCANDSPKGIPQYFVDPPNIPPYCAPYVWNLEDGSNSTYVSHLNTFLTALGAHIESQSYKSSIAAIGVPGGQAFVEMITCCGQPSFNQARSQSPAYTRAGYAAAWESEIDTMVDAFPTITLDVNLSQTWDETAADYTVNALVADQVATDATTIYRGRVEFDNASVPKTPDYIVDVLDKVHLAGAGISAQIGWNHLTDPDSDGGNAVTPNELCLAYQSAYNFGARAIEVNNAALNNLNLKPVTEAWNGVLKEIGPVPICVVGKIGDLDGDGDVDIVDLSTLISNWGATSGPADINNDETVDIFDLSILLSHWEGTSAPEFTIPH
jgi:hypothetical protein